MTVGVRFRRPLSPLLPVKPDPFLFPTLKMIHMELLLPILQQPCWRSLLVVICARHRRKRTYIADSRWDKRYQELVDYKAKHGVRFDSKVDTHCTCDYFVDSTSAFVDTQDCHTMYHSGTQKPPAWSMGECPKNLQGVGRQTSRRAHQSLGSHRL
jgi:hypothetical protein